MKHPYKIQLQKNLQTHYNQTNWVVKNNFERGRDEILFILPKHEDIKMVYANLYAELSTLPDIDHPSERVLISFCYPDGSQYCSRVINPNKQDEIHLALLGQLPKRSISDLLLDLNETGVSIVVPA
ncbi:hypothetical protein [Pedobacter nyackensis]|uniref:Uncharacterized protein n=1 Tax=Pedobacter nyackensis TaxID=475255 RepID=A0A1W2EL85_9SPHI|nr:hypothetical protein [Pedobacter nyackensis]SMD10434.1 hypothetical protein SAMN04488101_11399 [Pedobacter nyackensis]